MARLDVGFVGVSGFPKPQNYDPKGADLLLYPTAIGSGLEEAGQLDTSGMWQKADMTHSVCNVNLCWSV